MSTVTLDGPTARPVRQSARRAWAMSQGELRLLWRNKTAMFTALAMPIVMVVILYSVNQNGPKVPGTFMAAALIGFALISVIYVNLVSTYVARREALVLKRLRTSEATDTEIMLGTAVPGLLFAAAWMVLSVAGAAVLLGLRMPVNPVLLVAGVAGGATIFILLAAATTAITKTTEMAQVTTLPMLIVSVIGSGLMFPVDLLPGIASTVAHLLPLTPAMDLIHLGLHGTTGTAQPVGFTATFGQALAPTAVMLVWIYLGRYATRRWFRWEPRT